MILFCSILIIIIIKKTNNNKISLINTRKETAIKTINEKKRKMRKIIKIISFKKKFGLFESSRLVALLHSPSHNFLLELLKTNAPSLQAFKWKRRIGERILSFHFKLDRPSREATRSHQDVLFGRGGISPRTNVQT